MWAAMLAIQPSEAASLNLGTASIAVTDPGGGDPCDTTDYLKLTISWTVTSGSGTVKIETSSNGSTWNTVATGVASSALSYLVEYEFIVQDTTFGTTLTFHIRAVNESDAADIAASSRNVRVLTCL